MRMLPQEVKQQAMWSCDKFESKPLELRRWIRERTQWMKWGDTSQKGKHNLLDGGTGDDASATTLEDALGSDLDLSMSDGQLAAFVRGRFGGTQKQQPRDRRPQTDRAPPRSKGDMTCPNCMEKGHTSQECKKPKIEMKDRKCFICNEPGHPASKCPKAHLKGQTKNQLALTDKGNMEGPAQRVLMSLEDSDGYVPAHRLGKRLTSWTKATSKPHPTALTINAVVESAFAKLARREAEERGATESPAKVDAPPPATGQRARKSENQNKGANNLNHAPAF